MFICFLFCYLCFLNVYCWFYNLLLSQARWSTLSSSHFFLSWFFGFQSILISILYNYLRLYSFNFVWLCLLDVWASLNFTRSLEEKVITTLRKARFNWFVPNITSIKINSRRCIRYLRMLLFSIGWCFWMIWICREETWSFLQVRMPLFCSLLNTHLDANIIKENKGYTFH